MSRKEKPWADSPELKFTRKIYLILITVCLLLCLFYLARHQVIGLTYAVSLVTWNYYSWQTSLHQFKKRKAVQDAADQLP